MNQALNDLVYKIGGDTSGFERAMKELDRRADKSAREVGGAFEKAGRSIGAIGRTMAVRFLGPLSAGALVHQVQATLRQTIEMVNELDASARTAGVGFEAFQELKYAAERNLVGVDALTDGLKEMQLRIDEVLVTGSGAAKEALAALGFTASELAEKLKQPDRLFEDIIERMRKFEKAAQIRLADELFGGTAGEQFVRLLDVGVARVSDLREEGRRLGLVFSQDVQQAVRDANNELNHMGTIVTAIANHARQKLVNAFLDVVDSFKEIEDWSNTNLVQGAVDVGRRDLEIPHELDALRQQREIYRQMADDGTVEAIDANIAALEAEQQALLKTSERIERTLALRKRLSEGGADYTPPSRTSGKAGSRSGSSASKIDRERAAVEALIASLEHELSLVGATELEKAKLNALRQAGANATELQRQKIEQLVTALHEEREAARLAEEAQRQRAVALDNLFQMGVDGITSIVDKSVKAEDAIKKLAVQLALAGAQAALLGSGPLAGLFGGASFVPNTTAGAFFMSGFSSGTANTGGQRGEPRGVVHGQEAVIPLPNGGKVPVELLMPQLPDIAPMRAGEASITHAPTYNINAPGGDPDEIVRKIEAYDRGRLARLAKDLPELRLRGVIS